MASFLLEEKCSRPLHYKAFCNGKRKYDVALRQSQHLSITQDCHTGTEQKKKAKVNINLVTLSDPERKPISFSQSTNLTAVVVKV